MGADVGQALRSQEGAAGSGAGREESGRTVGRREQARETACACGRGRLPGRPARPTE